jgi:hypothetical protein
MPETDAVITATFIAFMHIDAVDPTCTADGNIEYYLSADGTKYILSDGIFMETTDVILPSGHNYGTPEWTWNGYTSAIAEFTCARCGDKQRCEATIAAVRTESTYDANGEVVYTATITFNGQEYSDTATEVLPKREKTDISEARLLANPLVFAYDGEEHTVSAKLKLKDGTVLKAGEDYIVTGNTATEKGTYQLTAEGIGAYTGKVYATWKICDVFFVTADLGNTVTVTSYEEKASAIVTAAAMEGKKFKCWKAEGIILSYSQSYSFIVTKDIELEAVYVDEHEEVVPKSVLNFTAFRNTYKGGRAIGLELTHSIPKEYKVIEVGIQYATNKGLGYTEGNDYANVNLMENSEWNVAELLKSQNNHIAKYKNNNGRYVFSVGIGNNVDGYIYALGYVKYLARNGEEQIEYCETVIAATYNSIE